MARKAAIERENDSLMNTVGTVSDIDSNGGGSIERNKISLI